MKKTLLGMLIVGSLTLFGCGATETHSEMSSTPSGDNCPENVAYLQEGVDKYKKELGKLPVDVNELLVSSDGKGPFVEKVPECPSGNIYVIENGLVKESPRK